MTMERGNAADSMGAIVLRNSDMTERGRIHGWYDVKCYDEQGNLKWQDKAPNVVTTVGANFLLDTFFGGVAIPSTLWMGLVLSSSPVFSTADTMASHAGWAESTLYTAPRGLPTWNAAAAKSKAANAVTFSILSSGVVSGAFLVSTSSNPGSTTGNLYSAGAFTGGNKITSSGDSLQVTYTAAV
jgi:hypothetical protein